MWSVKNWRLFAAFALITFYALVLWRDPNPEPKPWSEMIDFGYEPDPAGAAEFLQTLEVPFFSEAAPDAMRHLEERDVFLHRAMHKAHQKRYGTPFAPGRQLNGSCVAWGAAHAVYCAESVEYKLGNRSEPPIMPATCSIYGGSRVESKMRKDFDGSKPAGGWSDGSTGYRAARWLKDWGVIYRKEYKHDGVLLDLTKYNKDRERDWGAYGNGGEDPAFALWLDRTAAETPCRHVVNVRTWEELCAAIGSGYPVTIASSQGFNRERDAAGFCKAQGTWRHQMVLVSLRFGDRPGALCINSWGNYVDGGKYPSDQPDGSFWIEQETCTKILAQGDSWAIAESKFKWRDITHDEWLEETK